LDHLLHLPTLRIPSASLSIRQNGCSISFKSLSRKQSARPSCVVR
jgi:hypothetical protein